MYENFSNFEKKLFFKYALKHERTLRDHIEIQIMQVLTLKPIWYLPIT